MAVRHFFRTVLAQSVRPTCTELFSRSTMSINATPTKSQAVHPQRDRDMPSRSDCGWQSQNAPLPAERHGIQAGAGDHDSKALRALVVIGYGASMPTVHNQTFHDN